MVSLTTSLLRLFTIVSAVGALVLVQLEDNYCNLSNTTRQVCTSDSDCSPLYACVQHAAPASNCFNNTRYYKIGCPCEDHSDCPEACYTGRNIPACGPWLF